jgi:hypothetical protein
MELWQWNRVQSIIVVEDICVVFGPLFDKNGYKYKLHMTIEFQCIIKSLYIHVFNKPYVLNHMFLEFVRVVVAKKRNQSELANLHHKFNIS